MRGLRSVVAVIAAGALLAPASAAAFALLDYRPGGPLTMNPNVSDVPDIFVVGNVSYREILTGSMTTWNNIGIGPSQDHVFFLARNPVIATGDPCSMDGVNEVRFTADHCGMAFGTALAITIDRGTDNTILEADMIFDQARP